MADTAGALTALLGDGVVSSDPGDLAAHGGDWSARALIARRSGSVRMPACVVRPRSVDEVAELLEWAHRERCPIVPFGGGSGVCEAIAPQRSWVVADLARLDQIDDVDETARLVAAQAGVTGPRLLEELAGKGWATGHEPQSVAISTVGGWVATRACGQLSARHGGIEDLLAGVEAVLPGGRVVRSKAAPRRATGPDVASLLVGSEGTLGVVTEATLRVVPQPGPRIDRALRFEHMTDGVAACRALAQSDTAPILVRLYDADDSTLLLRSIPGAEPGVRLLLSFEGGDADRRAERALELAGGTADDENLVAHWWEHRNDAVTEFARTMAGEGILGPHPIIDTMEVAGRWSLLRDLYHRLKGTLSREADFVGCHLSHVYPDGACLYFTMAATAGDDDDAVGKLDRWWDAGMEACLAAGGTISHHHGIGRLKARWLAAELGEWWPVLQAVKAAIDPHRIMNPGVLGL